MADSNVEGYADAGNEEAVTKPQKDYEKEKRPEKEKSRETEKNREGKRSKKRSRRERSYTRSSSSSRKRSRRRRYDDENDKERRRYDEDSDSDNYHHRNTAVKWAEDRVRSRWNDGIPNNVLLIRNLSMQLQDDDVHNEFLGRGISLREVRLMRSRDTGESLRYCFVEFFSVNEAEQWMQLNQGEMRLDDGRTWYMYYSTTRRGNIQATPHAPSPSINDPQDWFCTKCSCPNFQRRTFCRRCSHAREDKKKRTPYILPAMSDGSDQVGSNPCNTLVLRGLDGLSTEESITNAILTHTSVQVLRCEVVRDGDTGASSGWCLLECATALVAQALLNTLNNPFQPLEVDGKVLVVNYAKNNFNTAMSTLKTTACIPHLTMPTSKQHFSENVAAAVAQAAMMKKRPHYNNTYQPPAARATTISPAFLTTATTNNAYPKYPAPDTSTFTYDSASGYYTDPSTHFYYDAKSQYFYNAHKQHFMYWDSDQSTYIPVSKQQATTATTITAATTVVTTTTMAAATTTTTTTPAANPLSENAKKIAKDMERWARRMNSQKNTSQSFNQPANQPSNQLINQPSNQPINQAVKQQPLNQPSNQQFSVSSLPSQTTSSKNKLQELDELYSRDESPPEDATSYTDSPPATSQQQQQKQQSKQQKSQQLQQVERNRLVEWERLRCLLCQRAFLSKETLLKHINLSSLHKNNLEEYLQTHGNSQPTETQANKDNQPNTDNQAYRDRARERRKKFGSSPTQRPVTNKKDRVRERDRNSEIMNEKEIARNGEREGVATKLMERMGWKEGQGLGKQDQGIVTPIEATMRQSLAGLGSRVAEVQVDGHSNDYNNRLKNSFRAYFNDIK